MRRKFFWSLLGAVAVTLFIVTLLGGLVSLSVVRAQTRSEMQRQIAQISELVTEAIVEDEIDLDRPVTRDLIAEEAAPSTRRVVAEAARVAGPEAQVRLVAVTTDRRVLGGDLPAPIIRAFDFETVLTGGTMSERVAGVPGRQTVEVVAQSVADLGGRGSVLAVVLIRDSDVLKLGSIMGQMVLPLLVAAVVAAVIAARMSRWLVARLAQLRSTAEELAAGDHDARVPVEGTDEIADVSKAFNDMADELDAARIRERQFLMSVGHDLRTPLTTISGYVEVLEEGDVESAEINRIAGVLDRETGRLKRLIEDLMLLARLESHEFSIRQESVDVIAHLGETVEAHRMRATTAQIDLEFVPTGGGMVMIDPDRLDQVVGNLIENALRYTPENGTVTVLLDVSESAVRLAVSDTGTGIAVDDLPHIFERFYVARKYRSVRPEGSGLGLAIVQEVVGLMGGIIEARSNDDSSGTTITVEFPSQPSPTI